MMKMQTSMLVQMMMQAICDYDVHDSRLGY